MQDTQSIKSYNLIQSEITKLADFDGAGMLYGVMYKGDLHFVMRERVNRGKSQFQVGIGGKFDHATDHSRFQRAKDETEEEFYGHFSLNQGMLIRHEDGKQHLTHYAGDAEKWAYVSGIAINNQPENIEEKLSQINSLNHLLWPFGDFFINNLQFNSSYSLDQARKTAAELLESNQKNDGLKNYVPAEIIRVLNDIILSVEPSLEELKNSLIKKYNLQSKRPFLELVDRIHADINHHALGDYTEAKSTGLIKATDLAKILKDPTTKAQIIYASSNDAKIINGADVFNNDASTALLSALYSPAYEKQLAEKTSYAQTTTLLKSEQTPKSQFTPDNTNQKSYQQ